MPPIHKSSRALQRALDYLQEQMDKAREGGRRQLPNVRTMSAEAGVAPRTLRKAVRLLADRNLLTVVNRGGVLLSSGVGTRASTSALSMPLGETPQRATTRERIVADIRSGHFPLGRQLPGYKELCRRYGCSYGTVRRVLDSLADIKILERQQRGFRVFAPAESSPYSTLAVIKTHAYLPSSARDRVMSVWRALERTSARRGLRLSVHGVFDSGRTLVQQSRSLNAFVQRQQRQNCLGYLLWYPATIKERLATVLSPLLATQRPVCLLEDTGVSAPQDLATAHARRPGFVWIPFGYGPAAGRDMGRYLFALGHRKVAWLTSSPGHQWSEERQAGLQQAFESMGLGQAVVSYATREPLTLHGTQSTSGHGVGFDRSEMEHVPPQGYGFTRYRGTDSAKLRGILRQHLQPLFERALADRALTAWVGANDYVALAAMEFLREQGVTPGNRISVAGFDDGLDAVVEDLTSYSFNEERVVDAIINHVLAPHPPRTTDSGVMVDVPGMVMARGTTGPARTT